jgi:hypothetical protein
MAEEDFKTTLLNKLPDIFDIVLILLGVAIVILAAASGYKSKEGVLPITGSTSRIALAAFGVVVMVVGLTIRLRGLNSTDFVPKPKDYDVKIFYPTPLAKVSRVDVGGSFKKEPPPGYSLWVFRLYDDGRIYPLRECTINEKEKTWEASDCDLGGKQGTKRSLSVNLVGKDGKALIAYIREAVQKFRPIRDDLVKLSGKNDVDYLPSVLERTRDMVQCSYVKVEKA